MLRPSNLHHHDADFQPGLDGEVPRVSADALAQENERLRAEVAHLRQELLDAARRGDLAEEALRESEERFRTMADGSPVMMWASQTGMGIRFINRACCDFCGIAEEHIHGSGWRSLVHPDDEATYGMACESALRARTPLKAVARLRRADGEWRWIEVHGRPYQSANGEHLGYVGISIDITERKRAEAEQEALLCRIQRSEEELDAVFKALPFLVSVHDKDGRYLRANPAFVELFGINPVHATREEVAQRLKARLPGGEPLTPENMPSTRALHGEPCFEVEYVITDAGGRDRLLSINAIPLTSNGQVYGAIFAQTDITARRNAERQLERANAQLLAADRQKNRFLAVLSHELRNPLTPISNSLHILQHVAPGGERATRALTVIRRQVRHLTRLVDDLLDMTRIVSGKLRLERTRFDLGHLVNRAAEDYRTVFASAGIQFDVRTCAGPLWMWGDETRMMQAMGNLLANAAKFTQSGGRVLFVLDADQKRRVATVLVKDNGTGISPGLLASVFEPFVQADESLDRAKGGLGLGLALVRSVADLHGGGVQARSDGPGKGAELIMRVPIEGPEGPDPHQGNRPG